ncbi:MAG: hypothetical protein MUE69_05885 [Myxococcota bacterium]|jgi:hypothetical protein|nr:hypothetical protein [Myxococcota bacterium]
MEWSSALTLGVGLLAALAAWAGYVLPSHRLKVDLEVLKLAQETRSSYLVLQAEIDDRLRSRRRGPPERSTFLLVGAWGVGVAVAAVDSFLAGDFFSGAAQLVIIALLVIGIFERWRVHLHVERVVARLQVEHQRMERILRELEEHETTPEGAAVVRRVRNKFLRDLEELGPEGRVEE